MAHEKLSPRQKMIGMMYLVLTAMLALNVSKDAVEAFKKVDKGLTLTVRNYELKNNLIYADFDRAAAENPTKAGKYRTTAYEVKQRADELFEYLNGLKLSIVTEAEGPEFHALKNGIVVIDSVKKIDEINIPTQILIGDDETGLAFRLKTMIIDYREFLIATLEGGNLTAENAIRNSLSTEDGFDTSGAPEKWELVQFYHLPLVACITMLSKMQVDIRNAETEVLNYLYTQIDASSFKFNKLNAIVIPKSDYVTLGDTYEATVFISATDTTVQPEIKVGEQILPLDETNKGVYTARASSLGSHPWGGIISLKAPDGTIKPYPFNTSYFVGEPNVVVSPTAMNVMYKGLDNPIDVSVPGVNPDRISIKVNNGTYAKKRIQNARGEFFRGNWAVSPDQVGKNVQVVVTTQDANGKATSHPPIEFRVKPLPTPIASFGGKSSGKISKAEALSQQGVFASMGADFDFELKYDILGFTVSYFDRGADRVADSNNWKLTEQQKTIVGAVTRGRDLTIKNIRAKGPDGVPRDLGAIVLTID
ncbi:MAG: gliding motility protein GldM [Bacteroidia bacterium]|nr:gliding motility protein GldM [Bacteroidia bacterium]